MEHCILLNLGSLQIILYYTPFLKLFGFCWATPPHVQFPLYSMIEWRNQLSAFLMIKPVDCRPYIFQTPGDDLARPYTKRRSYLGGNYGLIPLSGAYIDAHTLALYADNREWPRRSPNLKIAIISLPHRFMSLPVEFESSVGALCSVYQD